MYYAWLIVFPCILEQEGLPFEKAIEAWEDVKTYNAKLRHLEQFDVSRAEDLTGIPIPHKNLHIGKVRSAAELESIRQKLKKNIMGIAFGTIGLGLYYEGHFSENTIRRIFFNADLTLAELERGSTSYDQLYEKLLSYGIQLERSDNDLNIPIIKRADRNE